jgi:phytoene synthase
MPLFSTGGRKSEATIDDAAAFCIEQVRAFDKERFLCNLFAPAEVRPALAALYALDLELSRIRVRVREPLVGFMRVQWWRDAIAAIYAGRGADHPVASALTEAIRRHHLPQEAFAPLLAARERELADDALPDMAALIGHVQETTAGIALLALTVLGCEGSAERLAARDVSVGWALAGLLRALPTDARARQLVVPQAVAQAAALAHADPIRASARPQLRNAISMVASTARQHLAAARDRRAMVSKRALPVLLWATYAQGHLNELKRVGHDPFAVRPHRRAPLRMIAAAVNHARGRY